MRNTVSNAIYAIADREVYKVVKKNIDIIINRIKGSSVYERLAEILRRSSYLQRGSAGSVGMVALAAILAVAPVSHVDLAKVAEDNKNPLVQSADNEQWLISIGGEMILAVDTKEEAEQVFEGVKSHYVGENPSEDTLVSFDKEFRWDMYDYQKVPDGEPAWVMDVDSAVQYILRGTATPKTYTIVGGDNLWDIAVKNGCAIDDLERMNPGISQSSLPIGSVINLYEAKSFIDVTTVQNVAVNENIPYETVYQDSSELYKGQTKVQKAGINGSRAVVKKVTKVNGVEVASEILSEQVVSEPQNQIALKGTAPMPVYVASVDTGKSSGKSVLSPPMSHMEISSGFGASRGSRRHAGVDLRNPKGTPFAACADGVVTQAGYVGSYGNIIKISHGNGLETYYAHCDAMYVTVGQAVSKGQTLGTVGRTGNATGYVLHFEVRQNGVAQNPTNYI